MDDIGQSWTKSAFCVLRLRCLPDEWIIAFIADSEWQARSEVVAMCGILNLRVACIIEIFGKMWWLATQYYATHSWMSANLLPPCSLYIMHDGMKIETSLVASTDATWPQRDTHTIYCCFAFSTHERRISRPSSHDVFLTLQNNLSHKQ